MSCGGRLGWCWPLALQPSLRSLVSACACARSLHTRIHAYAYSTYAYPHVCIQYIRVSMRMHTLHTVYPRIQTYAYITYSTYTCRYVCIHYVRIYIRMHTVHTRIHSYAYIAYSAYTCTFVCMHYIHYVHVYICIHYVRVHTYPILLIHICIQM